jgi:hypothetical protein
MTSFSGLMPCDLKYCTALLVEIELGFPSS